MPFPAQEAILELSPPQAAMPYAPLLPRAVAHLIDMGLVAGLSFSGARFFASLLLAFHAKAVDPSPHARALFVAALDYGTSELFGAALAALGLLYFVALPLTSRKTFGMSLLGLELRNDQGGTPTLRQLLYRMLGCTVQYATMGITLLSGFGGAGEARFLADRLSGTRIVSDT